MTIFSRIASQPHRGFTYLAAGLSLGLATPALAQGDLLIAPTRLVVNGGGSSQIILSNIGNTPATYRISLELRRMQPDGDILDVPEAEANATERAALDMIRYSPRRIALAPNQPQAVRISVRPPEGLADGEYRVHMSFRAVPDAAPVAPAPADGTPPSGLSIKLTPIYGITIPLIVRKGQLSGSATLANPQVVTTATGQPALRLELNRSGQRSVFGEIRVTAPGAKEPVFLVRGIAVYPEVTHRRVEVGLSAEQAARLKGPLHFEYRELPENGGAQIAAMDANLK
ncbi:MAG: molecular chaperone [Sphingomonadales bacterium]|nr:molecular chaperone [Sphingomonadales bacterium]